MFTSIQPVLPTTAVKKVVQQVPYRFPQDDPNHRKSLLTSSEPAPMLDPLIVQARKAGAIAKCTEAEAPAWLKEARQRRASSDLTLASETAPVIKTGGRTADATIINYRSRRRQRILRPV